MRLHTKAATRSCFNRVSCAMWLANRFAIQAKNEPPDVTERDSGWNIREAYHLSSEQSSQKAKQLLVKTVIK